VGSQGNPFVPENKEGRQGQAARIPLGGKGYPRAIRRRPGRGKEKTGKGKGVQEQSMGVVATGLKKKEKNEGGVFQEPGGGEKIYLGMCSSG